MPILFSMTDDGNLRIPIDGERLFFGQDDSAQIYYDGQDFNIGFTNPSIGILTQKVRINDDLLIDGILTVGDGSIYMEADPHNILNWRGSTGQLMSLTDGTGLDLFKVFGDAGDVKFTINNSGLVFIDNVPINGAENQLLVMGNDGIVRFRTSYDAVFVDISDAGDYYTGTEVETALQEIGNTLFSLTPPTPPFIDDRGVKTGIDVTTIDGTTADITWTTGFGVYEEVVGIGSNSPVSDVVGVDASFSSNVGVGDRGGVINTSTDMTGKLNEDVTADTGTPNPAYSADAFEQGSTAGTNILILELNGVELTSQNIDLTTAGAQDTTTDTDSGLDVSAEQQIVFTNGDPFASYYRDGTWKVDSTDMELGWNYIRVIHRVQGDADRTSNYADWVVDDDTTDTSYATTNGLHNLLMTGSQYLSGVEYHTDGTADYDVVISNAFRNTYQTGNIITFSCSNGAISAQSLGDSSGNQALTRTITDADFNVSSGRKLNATISASTSVARTFNDNEDLDPGASSSIVGLLTDDQISGASGQSDTAESFNAEGYRQESEAGSFSLTNTASYASGTGNGPAPWTNTQSLVGANAGHNNGLLQYAGTLRYPTEAGAGDFDGDFDSITNAPAGNVDYSLAAGDRVYLRYFYVGTGKQTFTFSISGTGTFVSVATGVSAQNITLEMLLPNTTQNGGATIEFKDCFVNYSNNDGIGCNNEGGTKAMGTTDWECTSGSRATSTSGNAIVIRITASAAWTGNVSAISVAV